jgi:hypothetical protein
VASVDQRRAGAAHSASATHLALSSLLAADAPVPPRTTDELVATGTTDEEVVARPPTRMSAPRRPYALTCMPPLTDRRSLPGPPRWGRLPGRPEKLTSSASAVGRRRAARRRRPPRSASCG